MSNNTSNREYYTSYYSVFLICLFLFLAVAVVVQYVLSGVGVVNIICGFIVLILFFLFYKVQVYSDGTVVVVRYGIGLMESCVYMNEVRDFNILQNRFLRTFLYTPRSKHALVINTRDGGRFPVPAYEPKKLILFLGK